MPPKALPGKGVPRFVVIRAIMNDYMSEHGAVARELRFRRDGAMMLKARAMKAKPDPDAEAKKLRDAWWLRNHDRLVEKANAGWKLKVKLIKVRV